LLTVFIGLWHCSLVLDNDQGSDASRASIWWKYLDEDSILPPPFTVFYFLHKSLCSLAKVPIEA